MKVIRNYVADAILFSILKGLIYTEVVQVYPIIKIWYKDSYMLIGIIIT